MSHQARIDILRGEAYWQNEAAQAAALTRNEFAVQAENYARNEAAVVNDMNKIPADGVKHGRGTR